MSDQTIRQAVATHLTASEELFVVERPTMRSVWIALSASLVFLGTVYLAMFYSGVLDAPSDPNGTKVLAAVLTLLGTLIAESVVVVGLVLNHRTALNNYCVSVLDQRRMWTDAAREALQRDVENERLRHETALRAVGMLAADSGVAHPAQQAAVITALVGLELDGLALALVADRWRDLESPIDSAVAVRIVDQLIDEGRLTPAELTLVAGMLLENSDSLVLVDPRFSYLWPRSLVGLWPSEMTGDGELSLYAAMSELLRLVIDSGISAGSFEMRFIEVISKQRSPELADGRQVRDDLLHALRERLREAGAG